MHPPRYRARSWIDKFRDAFRGIWLALVYERSFHVHLVFVPLVIVASIIVRVTLVEGCVLGLCVALVLVSEMLNTAIEWLARAVDASYNVRIGAALDIGSGAVLVASLISAGLGGAILLYRLGVLLAWWA
jgi:diacylglycerol kinase